MRRIDLWTQLAASLVLVALAGCPQDDESCGNGKIEGGEQCDLLNLDGAHCEDLGFVGGGTLACTESCRFDTTGCSSCGDGEVQVDEECDCGRDATHLGAGCLDINGGPDGDCRRDCRLLTCGNGTVEPDEECDCGTDPGDLPRNCRAINGDPRSDCSDHCLDQPECGPSNAPYEGCEPTAINACCPDAWDGPLACVIDGADAYCLRQCSGHTDCYWSNTCGGYIPGTCGEENCGPGWDVEDANVPCQVGGNQGFCWPLYTRDATDEPFYSYCVESGTLSHDAPCSYDLTPELYDRSVSTCRFGACISGYCYQFCVGDESYDAAFYGGGPGTETHPCPAAANCYSESTLDPSTGLRYGDLSYCVDEIESLTCSLITNQLLSDPSTTCADVMTHGRCIMTDFGGELTEGTRIGYCEEDSGAPTHVVWQPGCITETDCPAGTTCVAEDFFGASTGTKRCVPYCDTGFHDSVQADCADLDEDPVSEPLHVIDASATCTSLSVAANPDDQYPTRLGLCALP